jgi:hypothetical protein
VVAVAVDQMLIHHIQEHQHQELMAAVMVVFQVIQVNQDKFQVVKQELQQLQTLVVVEVDQVMDQLQLMLQVQVEVV